MIKEIIYTSLILLSPPLYAQEKADSIKSNGINPRQYLLNAITYADSSRLASQKELQKIEKDFPIRRFEEKIIYEELDLEK